MFKFNDVFDFKLEGLEPGDRKFVKRIYMIALIFTLVILYAYSGENRELKHQYSPSTVQTQQR